MPFLTASAAVRQMDPEFERVGHRWGVVLPRGLAGDAADGAAFDRQHPMYFFLNAMVTLSAVVFLVAPGTGLAAVAVLLMGGAGDTAQAAAMSVLVIAVGLAVRLLCWGLLRGLTRRTQTWTAPRTDEPAAERRGPGAPTGAPAR